MQSDTAALAEKRQPLAWEVDVGHPDAISLTKAALALLAWVASMMNQSAGKAVGQKSGGTEGWSCQREASTSVQLQTLGFIDKRSLLMDASTSADKPSLFWAGAIHHGSHELLCATNSNTDTDP